MYILFIYLYMYIQYINCLFYLCLFTITFISKRENLDRFDVKIPVIGERPGRIRRSIHQHIGKEPEVPLHGGLPAHLIQETLPHKDVVGRQDERLDVLREVGDARNDLSKLLVVLVLADVVVHLGGELVQLRKYGDSTVVVRVALGRVLDVVLEEEGVAEEALHRRDQEGQEVAAPALRKVPDALGKLLELALLLDELVDVVNGFVMCSEVNGVHWCEAFNLIKMLMGY